MSDSAQNPDTNNILEELEKKIEKYPYAISPLLIDEFFIMGYTDIIKNEKIIKSIVSEIKTKLNYDEYRSLKELKIYHLPSALSTISSESNIIRIDIENITGYAFPSPPKIYCYIEDKEHRIKDPGISNNIFSNINNNTVCIGYVYCFYEKKEVEIKKGVNLIFLFPKYFIIISQYNYFYAFHNICKYIHQQFLRDNNEIPLEIQIYNMVNFLPCPLNSKIELSIFAINGVLNCKNLEEFKNLGKNIENNSLFLDQLGAYKHSEINFGKIFEICSPELIVRILFLILYGGGVTFFHENLEILSYVIYFFYQITFPITPKENIYCFSPNIYYFGDSINFEDNITGFPCFYDKVKDFNPNKNFLIYEKEQEMKRKGDENKYNTLQYTIINLKDGTIKFYSSKDAVDENGEYIEEEGEPEYEKDEKGKMEINDFLTELFKNKSISHDEGLKEIINELYNTLQSISNSVKEKSYHSYFVENNEIKKYSSDVQEAFLRFIILFYNQYFKSFGKMAEEKEKRKKEKEKSDAKESEKKISEIEKKIYSTFRKTFYNNIVENIKDYYKEGEPLFMKATKINFMNMMSICMADKSNKLLFKGHFIDFLDCIFFNKKKISTEHITFFEFFKYYNDNIKKYVFDLINDEDIIDKRIIKKENEVNYYYKYKTINLSSNLLLKYNIYLSELDQEIKNKLFPKQVNMVNNLNIREVYNLIDDYLIDNNLLNMKNLLQFCLLSIVVLSIPELKIMTFTEPIYNLFSTMNLQIRKYVNLILNVFYRYILKKNIVDSKEEINQYYNIFKKGIEEKDLYTNDELCKIRDKMEELINQKKEGYNLMPKNIINKILSIPEESLFKLIPEKLGLEKYEDVQKEGTIDKKISITGNLLGKEISSEFIYYPNTLYKKLNELVYKFYMTMDLENDRDEYYKLIINVMFYIRLIKDKFPDNTLKFLFYCLINEKEQIVKEAIKDYASKETSTPSGNT